MVSNTKFKHWCGFTGIFAMNAAPVLEFISCFRKSTVRAELVEASKRV